MFEFVVNEDGNQLQDSWTCLDCMGPYSFLSLVRKCELGLDAARSLGSVVKIFESCSKTCIFLEGRWEKSARILACLDDHTEKSSMLHTPHPVPHMQS